MKSLFSKEELLVAIDKYNTIYDVAKYLGCCCNTVRNYLKKYSVTTPSGFFKTGKQRGRKPGFKMSQKDKDLRSKSSLGKNNPFYGKKHTQKTKKLMSKNHADFSGDKNPFKKMCIKNPEILLNCSISKTKYWSNLNTEQRYTINKKVVIGDLSRGQWYNIQKNAESRNIILDITPCFIWSLFLEQDKKCSLSGIDLNLKTIYEITASLDRIDSNRGYTEDNVQWIHKKINWMKGILDNKEFIDICTQIGIWNKIL